MLLREQVKNLPLTLRGDILMKQRRHIFCLMVIFYVGADELQAPSQSRNFASYLMHSLALSKKR
jgi:hypothetical protein